MERTDIMQNTGSADSGSAAGGTAEGGKAETAAKGKAEAARDFWPRSYYIQTYGCQMNVYDSEIIGFLLEERGCVQADSEDKADIVVFNTCCIRDNADQKVYGRMGDFKNAKEKNERFVLVVAGCLAQKDKEAIAERFPQIDIVLGTHQVSNLASYVDEVMAKRRAWLELKAEAEKSVRAKQKLRRQKRGLNESLIKTDSKGNHLQLLAHPSNDFMAMTPISVGCNQWCTYCIVPHVRGPLHSRPLKAVVGEVKRLLGKGCKEIMLLGQNVNDYGRDLHLQEGFAKLLGELTPEKAGSFRLRFTSPHPAYFTEAAIEAMAANPNVCPHIHLPLQSGDDRILEVMHRRYTGSEFIELTERMRRAIPGLCITTDIIVGFADETEEEFQHTLDVVRRVRFDSAFMFAYSERPGTPGSEFPNRIPEPERLERLHRLIEVQNEISEDLNKQRVGLETEILVEGPSKKDEGRYTGRNAQHWLIHVDSDRDLTGQFVKVRLEHSFMWGFTAKLI